MEQVEGGVSKAQWCVIGGGLGAVVGMATGGPLGALGVMSAAAWILSC